MTTEFGALVADINRPTNGNGAEPHAEVPDWMRTLLQQVGKYVEAQVKPLLSGTTPPPTSRSGHSHSCN